MPAVSFRCVSGGGDPSPGPPPLRHRHWQLRTALHWMALHWMALHGTGRLCGSGQLWTAQDSYGRPLYGCWTAVAPVYVLYLHIFFAAACSYAPWVCVQLCLCRRVPGAPHVFQSVMRARLPNELQAVGESARVCVLCVYTRSRSLTDRFS